MEFFKAYYTTTSRLWFFCFSSAIDARGSDWMPGLFLLGNLNFGCDHGRLWPPLHLGRIACSWYPSKIYQSRFIYSITLKQVGANLLAGTPIEYFCCVSVIFITHKCKGVMTIPAAA